jgi:hypothetical protein
MIFGFRPEVCRVRLKWRLVLTLLALALMAAPPARADEGIDEEGFITKWLILAPIPLDFEQSGADGVKKEQIKDEAKLRPEPGDKVKFGVKELFWKKFTASDYFIDFNEFLGNQTEDSVAYAVTYIMADEEHNGVRMKSGSDDQCRIYLNGSQVLVQTDFRPLKKDLETTEVKLQKGLNIVVFKVVNEKVDWSGCMRFVDANGRPIKGLKVKLTAK